MKFTPETRIYIAGCGGMLGEAVHARFSRQCFVRATDIDVNEPWLSYGDVRDYTSMERDIHEFRPDLIINLAALTDLEYCESNPENSWLTNSLGAENLGLIANKLDVPYVYISTAGIFAGEKEFYTDFDTPAPLGYYAKSKYEGEKWVRTSVEKHLVLRAGWMMGGGPKKDKKFINKIYKQLKAGKTTLHVVDDKLGTPTYTVDFALGIQRILESELWGLYNQVCRGSCSRFDTAVELVRLLGLDGTVTVEKVDSSFFAAEYFAPRPASEKLVTLKLDARGLNVMRDWRVALAEYVEVFKADMALAPKSWPNLPQTARAPARTSDTHAD
jgi:dTDP-4-dehydrorhamnose reductase